MGFGPNQKSHFVAYTKHHQRQLDVQDIGKDGDESDTTQESDTDTELPTNINQQPTTATTTNNTTSPTTDKQPTTTTYKDKLQSTSTKKIPPHQRLTRQEAKQLDREIPWREILKLPEAKVQKYLAAVSGGKRSQFLA